MYSPTAHLRLKAGPGSCSHFWFLPLGVSTGQGDSGGTRFLTCPWGVPPS